jgi:chaperonin GroES
MEGKIKFKPLGDRILIEPFSAEDISPGGIHLINANQEPGIDGIVRAVGRGRTTEKGILIPPEVSVGDQAVFQKYGGSEVVLKDSNGDSRNLRCIREDEIVGVIE